MAANDVHDEILVFSGIEEGVCQFEEFAPHAHQKALVPWTKGSSDTDAGHGTFLMFCPVDPAKKHGKMKYHVICSPFDPLHVKDSANADRTAVYPSEGKDEEDLYKAMVFATLLQTKYGRVWTKDIWAEKGETDPEAYPFLSIHEFRNPVFCAWKYEGEFYGFCLLEDDKTYHETNKEHSKKLHKVSLKQRDRRVRMNTAGLTQQFQNVQITGLNITWLNRKAGWKRFSSAGDVTVEALKELIAAAEAQKR